VPIEGVLVTLAGGANKTTDAEGAFVFSNLEPGDYFLTASKPGYFPVQASTSVVAGERDPPITKVTLLVDQASQPFAEVLQWSAFLQCGMNAVAISLNPCAFTGSDNVHDFEFNGQVPQYAQAEVVWTGTQPLGNWLSFSIHDPDTSTGSCYRVNSQSPAVLKANQTQITDCYGEDAELLTYKIFPGSQPGTPPVPTVLTNQRYDVYVQYFYGFTPREDYFFHQEGPCEPITVCQ